MRVPLRALRKSFCTTSLWVCGQYHARSQPPPVDDVADQIDGIGVVVAQEVQQQIGLATARAEVNVGNEERSKSATCAIGIRIVRSDRRACI